MKVELIDYDSIMKIIKAARVSHGSESDNMGPRDRKLIKKLIQWGHESVLEHCSYSFKIEDVSRALLQELVRHRIASYTVRSTRYTLNDIMHDRSMEKASTIDEYSDIVEKYCVVPELPEKALTKYIESTFNSLKAIYALFSEHELKNDQVKYLLPESFKTELIMSINVRSFRNFLNLRGSKKALWEIKNLAIMMFEKLPKKHHILYEDLELNAEST